MIPNTSKGSGDPKPNFIRIINFVCFQRFCSFSKWMSTFSCTGIPHTHAKNGCTVFPNIPAVFCGGCIVLRGGYAILRKTCIICDVQEIYTKDYYFNKDSCVPVCCVSGMVVISPVSYVVVVVEGLVGVSGTKVILCS